MLAGSKVVIRPIERSDLDTIHRWYNDDEVNYWGSGAKPDIMVSLAYLDEIWYDEICTASSNKMIIETKEGQPIGLIGYRNMNMQERRCRLSVFLGEKGFWGKGCGTDAVKTFLKFLFDRWNLNRVELDTWDGNDRAVKCYEKCGFKFEGRLRKARFVDGEYKDEIIMGILREEFK